MLNKGDLLNINLALLALAKAVEPPVIGKREQQVLLALSDKVEQMITVIDNHPVNVETPAEGDRQL